MSNTIYDVIVIGAGPAGLTAALYTSRQRNTTLLLEKNICGGLVSITGRVENYPGFPEGISGIDLMERMKQQAEKFGAVLSEFSEVEKITFDNSVIKVLTSEKQLCSYSLIIATGTIPRKLNIPGEEKYTGRGVSYCATCDGPLFRDKHVLVIGGGDTAVEEALFLSTLVGKVTLLHRRDELRASKILQERFFANNKIEPLLESVPVSIDGDDLVRSVRVRNTKTGKEDSISVDGVFICVGYNPNTAFLPEHIKLDDAGFVITDDAMRTSLAGIFAAGDVRSKEVRQIAVACGEATIAAISVRGYLNQVKQ